MQDSSFQPGSSSSSLPDYIVDNNEGRIAQKLFNSIRTALLYLDQWGAITSANMMAEELFRDEQLAGKTVLEFLSGWEDKVHAHQEVLLVARSGVSVLGVIEHAVIHGKEHWFHVDKIAIHDDEFDIKGVLVTLDDVTELKQQEILLQQSEARYRAFVDNSQDAIWCYKIDPPIAINCSRQELIDNIIEGASLRDCNQVFANIYNKSPEQLIGLNLKDTRTQSYRLNIEKFVDNNFRVSAEKIMWKNNSEDDVCLQISANGTIENNHLVEIWGVTLDTTERQRYIDRLEYQANHDLLTGLPNRNKLKNIATDKIAKIEVGQKLALIIVDLDSFKDINDTLGHHIGDEIIKQIGPRIDKVINSMNTTVCRLGGDEFGVLLHDIKDESQAYLIAEQIHLCIRKLFYINDMDIEIRASLGISMYPSQAPDFSTMLRFADVAMYTAKHSMSNIEIYSSEKDKYSTKRLALMNELGKAIREGQLELHYQPKVSLITGEVMGVEALSRWIHPTMGYISPAEFVPIAEMTDMINEMTTWVLSESLAQVWRWQKQGVDIKVAVNISARNLLDENIVTTIKSLLLRYQLSPSCLELEITESSIMNNADYSLKILTEINNIGIDLSVDDFGTGYSSLAYLKKLPVKWLKIDYAFIINMLEDEQDQIIVSSTINMAHNLGLGVIAEGVENQEILDKLTMMKCECAQGYHIARPMAANIFDEWFVEYSKNKKFNSSPINSDVVIKKIN
jgi:diguanylate cyclase (GGDEF)-like protein/PAS domain S-box-containing protein